MTAGKLETAFGSFSQTDASTTRQYGGTGLGLTISWRLSEMMGGALEVESTSGEEATFACTFQARAAALPSSDEA